MGLGLGVRVVVGVRVRVVAPLLLSLSARGLLERRRVLIRLDGALRPIPRLRLLARPRLLLFYLEHEQMPRVPLLSLQERLHLGRLHEDEVVLA